MRRSGSLMVLRACQVITGIWPRRFTIIGNMSCKKNHPPNIDRVVIFLQHAAIHLYSLTSRGSGYEWKGDHVSGVVVTNFTGFPPKTCELAINCSSRVNWKHSNIFAIHVIVECHWAHGGGGSCKMSHRVGRVGYPLRNHLLYLRAWQFIMIR